MILELRKNVGDMIKGIISKEKKKYRMDHILMVKRGKKRQVSLHAIYINKAFRGYDYHIPTIVEILPKLEAARIFSTYGN